MFKLLIITTVYSRPGGVSIAQNIENFETFSEAETACEQIKKFQDVLIINSTHIKVIQLF